MSDELGRWVCLFLLLCSQLVASTAKNSAGAVGPILKPLHRPFGPCKFSYCSASQDEIADHIGPPSASNVYARVLWQECSAGGVFFFSPLKVDSDPTFKCAKGTGLAIKGAFCHRPCEAYTNAGSIRLAKLENIQERGVPSLGVVATRDGQWVAPKFDGGPYKLAHYDRIHGACQFSYCSAILEEASNHRGPPPKTNRALARVFRECFTINTKWEKGPINIYDIGDSADCKQGRKLHIQDVYCPRACESYSNKRAGYLLFRPLGPTSYGVLGKTQPSFADHIPPGSPIKPVYH